MSITTSSAWFDQSANANKLRQSYLKGFLDISGGGVYVRADNSLNFYTAGSATVPKFSMNAEKITVVSDGSNNGQTENVNVSFSTRKLAYLWDLSENVQQVFKDIRSVINGTTTAAATSTQELDVITDANIGGNLVVGGNVYIDQNLAVSGNVTIGENLSVKGNALFGGNVEIAGSQTINMNLYVKGDTFLSGRLFVTADCSFHSNIGIYGNTTTVGSVIAGGDLSASGRLLITKESVMQSTLSVGGASTLTGAATLASTLSVGAAVTFANTLDVTQATVLASTLSIGAATILNSTLSVGAATILTSTLSVGAATILTSTLSVGDSITMADGKIFKTNKLEISSSSVANDPALIKVNDVDLTITAGVGKKVHITSDLVVDGSFTFLGQITQTDVDIKVTNQLDISANGVTALIVNQAGNKTVYDIANFFNTSATPVFTVGKNDTVVVNKSEATIGFHFDVSGKSLFSDEVQMKSTLSVASSVTMADTLTVTKATTLVSSLSVGGLSIMNSTLSVGAAATFNSTLSIGSDATFNTKLSVGGAATFASLATFNAGIAQATGYYLDQSSDW